MILEIRGKTQSYDWGKLGSTSKVAILASNDPGFKAAEEQPFAELWMGTHPNGPSVAASNSTPLKDYLNETTLSQGIAQKYNNDLPFLFKVLSIRKALSIQAHPDKKLAQELFEKFPKIYKDPNHKPEMAIALTEFEAFIGFKPLQEIADAFSEFPEFVELVGKQVSESFKSALNKSETEQKSELKTLFGALMNSNQQRVATLLKELVTRIKGDHPIGSLKELFIRLDSQFPGDIGCFCAIFLNYVSLKPGQAIFLAANEPHAYLSGDCVECMAASDNVVRSGLTPKFKDVQTLLNMLTFKFGPADAQIMNGQLFKSEYTRIFDPPIEEFAILKTVLANGQQDTIESINGPSILIVTLGSGEISSEGESFAAPTGSIWFISANSRVTLRGSSDQFISYRAFCQ